MARTMLNRNELPKYFWTEAATSACYIINDVLLKPLTKTTPYELWHDINPTSAVKVFGSKCFILNNNDQLHKFNSKAEEGISIGYSTTSEA